MIAFDFRIAQPDEVKNLPISKATGGLIELSGPAFVFGRGIRVYLKDSNALIAVLVDSWPRWYFCEVQPGTRVLFESAEAMLIAERYGISPSNTVNRAYVQGGTDSIDRFSAISTSHAFSVYYYENVTTISPALEDLSPALTNVQYRSARSITPMPVNRVYPAQTVANPAGYDAVALVRKPDTYRFGSLAGAFGGSHFYWVNDALASVGVRPGSSYDWSNGMYISGTYSGSRNTVSNGTDPAYPSVSAPEQSYSDATPVWIAIYLTRTNDTVDLILIGDVAALAPAGRAYNFTIAIAKEFFSYDSSTTHLYKALHGAAGLNHLIGLYCPVQEIGATYTAPGTTAADYATRDGSNNYFGCYLRWYQLADCVVRAGTADSLIPVHDVTRPSIFGSGAASSMISNGLQQ